MYELAKRSATSFQVFQAVVLLAGSTAAIAPFVLAIVKSDHNATFFESTIYSANLAGLLSQIKDQGAVWAWGQYRVHLISYLPMMLPIAALEQLGIGKAVAALGWISALITATYLALYQLCLSCLNARMAQTRRASLWAALAALAAVCALPNFNYIKSTFFFVLPTISTVLLIWTLSMSSLRKRPWARIVILCAFSMLGTTVNATLFLYSHAFALVLAWTWGHSTGLSRTRRDYFVDALSMAVAAVPSFLLVASVAVLNPFYFGDVSGFISQSTENMYSLRSAFSAVFTFTTDWGLFDGFGGRLYYEFSPFYAQPFATLFVYLFWTLLITAVLRAGSAAKRAARITTLVQFALCTAMIGLPVLLASDYWLELVRTVPPLAIFRNITKLAPFLLLSTVLLLVTMMQRTKLRVVNRLGEAAVLALLAYSIPYWTYAEYFTRDRIAPKSLTTWSELANSLPPSMSGTQTTLLLPAMYNNDQFIDSGRILLPQGVIADLVAPTKAFRLVETFGGVATLSEAMHKVFVPNQSRPRGLMLDHGALADLVAKINAKFLLVTSSAIDEYSNKSELAILLEQLNAVLVHSTIETRLYELPTVELGAQSTPQLTGASGVPDRGWATIYCGSWQASLVAAVFSPLQMGDRMHQMCFDVKQRVPSIVSSSFIHRVQADSMGDLRVFIPHVIFCGLVLIALLWCFGLFSLAALEFFYPVSARYLQRKQIQPPVTAS